MERLVSAWGIEVEGFASAESFLTSDRVRDTACLILDVDLHGMGGLQLQSQLASSGLHIPIILITTNPDEKTREKAVKAGVQAPLHGLPGEMVLVKKILAELKVGGQDKAAK